MGGDRIFISVSKNDLSGVFVSSGDGGDMWLLGVLKKKDGAIFIYKRHCLEVLMPSYLTAVFLCSILMPFKYFSGSLLKCEHPLITGNGLGRLHSRT